MGPTALTLLSLLACSETPELAAPPSDKESSVFGAPAEFQQALAEARSRDGVCLMLGFGATKEPQPSYVMPSESAHLWFDDTERFVLESRSGRYRIFWDGQALHQAHVDELFEPFDDPELEMLPIAISMLRSGLQGVGWELENPPYRVAGARGETWARITIPQVKEDVWISVFRDHLDALFVKRGKWSYFVQVYYGEWSYSVPEGLIGPTPSGVRTYNCEALTD